MNLKIYEKVGDLFDYKDDHYLAHCIASDFGMLGGIAKQFVDKMAMRNKLTNWADEKGIKTAQECRWLFVPRPQLVGKAVLIDNTFNLITKELTSDRPTYKSLGESLEDMKRQVEELDIKKLAMPRIGCGIDGLNWVAVYSMIVGVFKNLDMEIIIVSLPDDADRGDIL